jgi:hypothetical protein
MRCRSLPLRLRDLKYRALVSGFLMGANKQRGEARFCVHCMHTQRTRQTARVFEDNIHVFASCPLASSLWRLVLAWCVAFAVFYSMFT